MGKNNTDPAKEEDKVPATPEVDGAGATPAPEAPADTAQDVATPSKKGFVTLDCPFGQICIDGENYQSHEGKVTVPKEHAEKAKKICG